MFLFLCSNPGIIYVLKTCQGLIASMHVYWSLFSCLFPVYLPFPLGYCSYTYIVSLVGSALHCPGRNELFRTWTTVRRTKKQLETVWYLVYFRNCIIVHKSHTLLFSALLQTQENFNIPKFQLGEEFWSRIVHNKQTGVAPPNLCNIPITCYLACVTLQIPFKT